MTAESYGGLMLGSKVLRGNFSPPEVAPRGVKNHPYALKSIFFNIASQKLVSKQLNGYRVICWKYPMLGTLIGPPGGPQWAQRGPSGSPRGPRRSYGGR